MKIYLEVFRQPLVVFTLETHYGRLLRNDKVIKTEIYKIMNEKLKNCGDCF